jgi:hypothetical protein
MASWELIALLLVSSYCNIFCFPLEHSRFFAYNVTSNQQIEVRGFALELLSLVANPGLDYRFLQ